MHMLTRELSRATNPSTTWCEDDECQSQDGADGRGQGHDQGTREDADEAADSPEA
jgi:hypothetical protein